jgi:hypothetical protein
VSCDQCHQPVDDCECPKPRRSQQTKQQLIDWWLLNFSREQIIELGSKIQHLG